MTIEVKPWVRVAITRLFAIGPAITVALVTANDPGTTNLVNEWINVLQSIQLPFSMLPAITFSGSSKLLGRFRHKGAWGVTVWSMVLLLLAVNGELIITFIVGVSLLLKLEPFLYLTGNLRGSPLLLRHGLRCCASSFRSSTRHSVPVSYGAVSLMGTKSLGSGCQRGRGSVMVSIGRRVERRLRCCRKPPPPFRHDTDRSANKRRVAGFKSLP